MSPGGLLLGLLAVPFSVVVFVGDGGEVAVSMELLLLVVIKGFGVGLDVSVAGVEYGAFELFSGVVVVDGSD